MIKNITTILPILTDMKQVLLILRQTPVNENLNIHDKTIKIFIFSLE